MDIKTKLNKLNGWQRLLTVFAIFWIVAAFFISIGMAQDNFSGKTNFVTFLGSFLLLNTPIWLTALIIWIFKGFNISSTQLKHKTDHFKSKFKSGITHFSVRNIKNAVFNLLKTGWQGKAPLWKIYWLVSFPFNIIVKSIINNINASSATLTGGEVISYFVFLFLVMCCSIFLIVANWRCAFNVVNHGWGYFVRFQCIIGILVWGSTITNLLIAIVR